MTSKLADYSYKIAVLPFHSSTREDECLVAYRQEDALRLTVNNC